MKRLLTLALALLFVLVVLGIIIGTRDYPDFVNTFSKRASVFFGMHNNELARLCLKKAKASEDAGLPGKSDYYIEWCERMNPNDAEVIDELAQHYFIHEEFDKALSWYKVAIAKEPNDSYYRTGYALCLSHKNLDAAVPFAEDLIEEDPTNATAICILRDYYNKKGEEELAFYWGLRAFYYRANRQFDHDLEVFGQILSKLICSTNYQKEEVLIAFSETVDTPRLFSFTYKEYDKRADEIKELDVLVLYMYNRIDIGILDDAYYFVYIPGEPEGQIWHSDRLKRNIKRLLHDYPSTAISSLVVID